MLFGTDHAAIKNCAIFTLGVHFAVVINVIGDGLFQGIKGFFLPGHKVICYWWCINENRRNPENQ